MTVRIPRLTLPLIGYIRDGRLGSYPCEIMRLVLLSERKCSLHHDGDWCLLPFASQHERNLFIMKKMPQLFLRKILTNVLHHIL